MYPDVWLAQLSIHLSRKKKKKNNFFGAPGAKCALMCSIQGLGKVDSPIPKCRAGPGWVLAGKNGSPTKSPRKSGSILWSRSVGHWCLRIFYWVYMVYPLVASFWAISDCNSHFSDCTNWWNMLKPSSSWPVWSPEKSCAMSAYSLSGTLKKHVVLYTVSL